MSVLVVTDDVDDEIRTQSICYSDESFYKQLKALEYDSSSGPPVSILQPSSSIVLASPAYYRLDHRRRPCRPQACWVQRWLTYMLTLLLLTNHFHWPLLVLSLSSITFVSAQAPTTTTSIPNAGLSSIKPRPILPPSTASSMLLREDEQQCLPMRGSDVDRICSKTCRARRTPFEKVQRVEQIFSEMRYLPFCSHHLLQRSIGNENFLNETSESECREILDRIIKSDEEARQASQLFATYMKAIDSASKENRYSIIEADCQVRETSSCLFAHCLSVSSKRIERGRVQSKFHSFIGINSYRLAKRSVMKWSVCVLHFDPVTVNHYLLDNRCSSAMVRDKCLRSSLSNSTRQDGRTEVYLKANFRQF